MQRRQTVLSKYIETKLTEVNFQR